ncbi:MAG: glycosyltransferase [Lachnospiraceae bacterium]|nr:glycosyltransferase [Lachnospiraceae bacterium]
MKLSVIVPAFNAGKYIGNCIDSIEHGSLPESELEVIVVNDGSTDNTAKVIDSKMQEYSNIQMVQTNDEGVSVARNRGMQKALGEYITFVDADDIVTEKMFSLLIAEAMESKADIVGCGFFTWSKTEDIPVQIIDGNNEDSDAAIKKSVFNSDDFIKEEIIGNHNSRCWSKIYSRKCLEGIEFKEGLTIGEDMLFLTQAVKKANSIVELDYKGYGYYQNEKGAMNRPFNPKYMDQITCWELMAQETGCDLVVNRFMSVMLVVSKIALLSKKDQKQNYQYINICKEKLKELINEFPEGLKKLDRGYRIKCRLFKLSPKLYLRLYGLWKK